MAVARGALVGSSCDQGSFGGAAEIGSIARVLGARMRQLMPPSCRSLG